MWEIMKYMVNIPAIPKNQDPLKSRSQRYQLIDQAKKYLENRYKIYMSTVISEHLRDAQRGGVPSTLNLVGAFVGLKFSNINDSMCIGKYAKQYIVSFLIFFSFSGLDGNVDGKPLWPMVYYCLRCGDIQSALKCMECAGYKKFYIFFFKQLIKYILDLDMKN